MRNERRRTYWIIFAVLVLIAGLVFFTDSSLWARIGHVFRLKTISDVRENIQSLGAWGPMFMIALMVLHSVTFVPSEVITISDMVIFGPIWGVVYSWTGAMLGAYLSFFLARAFGRPIVDRFVPRQMLSRLDQFFEREGVKGIFVLRLIPLISFNALNYASGLTRMTLWQFTWTTGVGILPAGVLFALLYQSTVGQKFGVIGLTVLGIAILIGMFWKGKLQQKFGWLKKRNE